MSMYLLICFSNHLSIHHLFIISTSQCICANEPREKIPLGVLEHREAGFSSASSFHTGYFLSPGKWRAENTS